MLFMKHREEHSSSRGFTIAELGAGMGVFALAAAMMAPVAMNAATSSLTGETVITVADSDGRKPITTPPVDAVEVTVVDANGNDVKTVTVNDPSATSTVISGLDSNATYTFEVAKVNMAGKSAKATAALEYKQTGTRAENYTVTEEFTDTASETVGSTAEQVDDTTKPQYDTVEDRSQKFYKDVQETYQVPVQKTGTRNKTIQVEEYYSVQVPYQAPRTGYTTERYSYNHVHESSYNHQHITSYNHVHYETYSYNHVHTSSYNHVHSSNHVHSTCHYHSRYYTCHAHTSNHTHYSNHTHTSSSNHTHSETRSTNHTHTDYSNHTHTTTSDHLHTDGIRQVSYTYYVTEYANQLRMRMVDKVVQESYTYTVMEDRQRTVSVFSHYGTKQQFRGYGKKTQYRLCYEPRSFGGGKGAQQCEIHSSPASKTITWQFTNTKVVPKTRYHAVYDHVKKAPEVRAPSGYVVFKASTLSNGRIMSSGEVAAVGSGVSGVSKGATKSFYRWSGRTFTFNGEQYVQVHNWALSK